MDTIELADGGILLYHDAFLPPDLADRYFVELRDTVGLGAEDRDFRPLAAPADGFLRRRGRDLLLLGHGEQGAAVDADPTGDQAADRGRPRAVQLLPAEPLSVRGRIAWVCTPTTSRGWAT